MTRPADFMILSGENIPDYLDERPHLGDRVGTVTQVEMELTRDAFQALSPAAGRLKGRA